MYDDDPSIGDVHISYRPGTAGFVGRDDFGMAYTLLMDKTWNIYLSGEIHADWREKIMDGCSANELPVTFTTAVTDHDASDAAGDA